MPRFTPVHGGGRYTYSREGDRYGGYPSRGGYYEERGYYGPTEYGDSYGRTYYDDREYGYGRTYYYDDDGEPRTVIVEREPEFIVDDEKLVGGSRPRLPQRMLRCASVGSLVEREADPVQWQRQVQIDRCCNMPWKRDTNQCDALCGPAPAKPLQRKVGWQQFEDAVVRSLDAALKAKEPPPANDNKVVVLQGGAAPAIPGQHTVVTQQPAQPKTNKYTVTVMNAPPGAPVQQMARQLVTNTALAPAAPVVVNRPPMAQVATSQLTSAAAGPSVIPPSQSRIVITGSHAQSQVVASGQLASQPAYMASQPVQSVVHTVTASQPRTPVASQIVTRS